MREGHIYIPRKIDRRNMCNTPDQMPPGREINPCLRLVSLVSVCLSLLCVLLSSIHLSLRLPHFILGLTFLFSDGHGGRQWRLCGGPGDADGRPDAAGLCWRGRGGTDTGGTGANGFVVVTVL
jgi:hypothetical protein